MSASCLIADIGSTNARFAAVENGRITNTVKRIVSDGDDGCCALEAAAAELYLKEVRLVALAVAGVVDQDRVSLTNGAWTFSKAGVKDVFPGARVEFYNDVQAAVLGLPLTPVNTVRHLSGQGVDFSKAVTLMMAGTGLGVACLLPGCDGPGAMATEAGHMALPETSGLDDETLGALKQGGVQLTAEEVVSGSGLSRVHQILTGGPVKTAAAIAADAREGDSVARKAVDQLWRTMGAVAHSLVVAHGAWGGVCLSGSVALGLAAFFAKSDFLTQLTAAGRFADRLKRVPVDLIDTDDLALLGLAHRHGQ